jgi:hypothetical protein
VTAHPELDLEQVMADAPALVDFRGVTRRLGVPRLTPS